MGPDVEVSSGEDLRGMTMDETSKKKKKIHFLT